MIYLLVKLIKMRKQDICVAYLLAIFVAKHAVEYAHVSYYARLDAYVIAIILGCLMAIQRRDQRQTMKQSPADSR